MKTWKWILSGFVLAVASLSVSPQVEAAPSANALLPVSVYDMIRQQGVTNAYYYHHRYYPGTAYRHHRRVHRRVYRRYNRYY